jgi:hypothetical protein
MYCTNPFIIIKIIGLEISSLPTFMLKSPNKIFVWYLEKWANRNLRSQKICPLCHHFYPQLGLAHSEH